MPDLTSPDTPELPATPKLNFDAHLTLEDGRKAAIKIEAIDHIAALIKLTAWLSDQPFAVAAVVVRRDSGRIIMPMGRG